MEKKLRQRQAVSTPAVVVDLTSSQPTLCLEVETSKVRSPVLRFVASKSVTLNRQAEGKESTDDHAGLISPLVRDEEGTWSLLQPPVYEVGPNVGDHSGIEFISTCLRKCLEDSSGESTSPPILPHRVLEITDAHTVRLLETDGLRAHYATLSHRWGKTSGLLPKQTKRRNLRDHLSHLPIDDLSTVFQHAIALTHMLDIKYLWIDSLCIVQDEKEDWVNESGRMGKTYGDSTLTIFASSTSGLFVRRGGFQKQTYDYRDRFDRDIVLTAQSQVQHSHVDSPFRQVAAVDLFKRGWVFQEWLLCSRAIVFSSNELLWSCDHAVCCECKPTPQEPKVIRESWGRYQYANLLHTRLFFRLETQQDRSEINWLRLAQAYTTTKLTYQEDRLPALSGLAKRWADYNVDGSSSAVKNYLAGCWRDQLVASLLWHSVPPRLPSDKKFLDMTRNEYIAPSWSWLSLPYYLKFSFIDTDRFRETGFVSRDLISVQDAQCTPATADPTGAVRDGYITVTGPFFSAVLTLTEHGKQRPEIQTDLAELDAYADHGSVAFSRLHATGRKTFNVTCLVVRASFVERRARYCEEGLILVPSATKKSSYERVGLFHTRGSGGNRLRVEIDEFETAEQFAIKTGEDQFDYLLDILRDQNAGPEKAARALLSEAPQRQITIV